MGPRFRSFDRDQLFLLPPDVREWLPPGHAALFVSEMVEALDLSEFVAKYESSPDRGRPAYHPQGMVGILLYASMTAVMSSRRIERLLATDAGFRVVAANERPDHVTICRFLRRHRAALGGLFAQVVGLAAEAGLIDPTLVAVDGTKMAGDASKSSNETLGVLRQRFSGWADTVEDNDRADDEAEQSGPDRGPVPEMADRSSMREWIQQRLRDRAAEADDRRMNVVDPDSGLMPRSGGGWIQGYNAQAAATGGGIVVAADVTATPVDWQVLDHMVRRIGDAVATATRERAGVVVADAGYWDTGTIDRLETDPDLPDVLVATGRKRPETVPDPLPEPDLDTYRDERAAYERARHEERARRIEILARVVAGELSARDAAEILGMSVPRVYELKNCWVEHDGPNAIPLPASKKWRPPKRPPTPTRAARARHAMDTRLASPAGRSLYRQRQAIIEPVFGDIKTNRRTTRFLRRGIESVRAEWHWILTGHNLTILHTHSP
jgi:transposase